MVSSNKEPGKRASVAIVLVLLATFTVAITIGLIWAVFTIQSLETRLTELEAWRASSDQASDKKISIEQPFDWTKSVETPSDWSKSVDQTNDRTQLVNLLNDSVEEEHPHDVLDLVDTPEEREKREVISNGHSPTDILKAAQGIQGPPGRDGKDGRDGRDAVNLQAVDKHINLTVKNTIEREMVKVEAAIRQIPVSSGGVYTRWGRTTCPSTSDLLLKGISAGTRFDVNGGAAEYLCLPEDPDHPPEKKPNLVAFATISGVEYQYIIGSGKDMHDENAPCAVCQAKSRPITHMFPAKKRCPDASWTKEYEGYLMTQWVRGDESSRTQYACVDSEMEAIPGHGHDTNGALFHHVLPECTSGHGTLGCCPPYDFNYVLTCVVCSK